MGGTKGCSYDYVMDNEWFDDDAPEEAELERENRVRHERFSKTGFREGVIEGSPVQHQAGLEDGYRSGFAKAKAVGFLQGCFALREQLHGSQEDHKSMVCSQSHVTIV